VLPINDISGQDSLFVRAMHDALTTAIPQFGSVGMAPVSEMRRLADGATPDGEVAQRLNLDALVVASVFRAGPVMRITVQFSDPATTRSLWSDTYERDVSDVLAAQSDIVGRIAGGVAGALRGTGQVWLDPVQLHDGTGFARAPALTPPCLPDARPTPHTCCCFS
jgi:serine/threonine-protein kinase